MAEENLEETEREEGGVTFGEIMRAIGRRIWWILGISVVAALILGLLTMFVLSPSKQEYQITFMMDYPNGEDMKRPDGTNLRYESIIYIENLEAAKAKSADFAKIDVEKMSETRSISIKELVRGEEENLDTENKTYNKVYAITVKASYFKDSKQASAFLKAVCDYSMEQIVDMVKEQDYATGLRNYQSAATYSEKITYLQNQQSTLLSYYDALTTRFGNFTKDDKTLNEYREELANALNGEIRISDLSQELTNERYLLQSQKDESILEAIKSLDREQKRNDEQLTELRAEVERLKNIYFGSGEPSSSQLNTFETFHTRIAELVARNALINVDREELCTSIDYTAMYDETSKTWTYTAKAGAQRPDDTQFAADLEALYQILVKETATCKSVIEAVYEAKSQIGYMESGVYTNGGTSTLLMAAVGFVAGFLIASIVFYFVDKNKTQKATAAGKKEEPMVVLEAEAATTQDTKKDEE